MSEVDAAVEAAFQVHQAQDFLKAERLYREILQSEPKHKRARHLLSLVYVREGKWEQAIQLLQALIAEPDVKAIYYYHLGNVYKEIKDYKKAIDAYEEALDLDPENASVFGNAGIAFFKIGELAQAVHCYQQAIHYQSDYLDAYYNLALAYMKQGELDEARMTLDDVLLIKSNYFRAEYQLGIIAMRQYDFEKAAQHFQMVVKSFPNHTESQINLGHALVELGRYNEARTHYRVALKLAPKSLECHYNLGVIAAYEGHENHAINHYRAVLKIDKNHFETHNNIAILYLQKNHIAYALKHFKAALAIEPDNVALQYKISCLENNKDLAEAPKEYLTTLFDEYADHYDQHLEEALDYQVPAIFKRTLARFNLSETQRVLDLGCGTGLCAPVLRPYAQNLYGVDLSDKMLTAAKAKHIYDKLYVGDMRQYLKEHLSAFDLVVAADVLVYIGNLAETFNLVANSLVEGGLFILNVEESFDEEFRVSQSGRFLHSQDYLKKLAAASGFSVKYLSPATTRMQNNEPVHGVVALLRRP